MLTQNSNRQPSAVGPMRRSQLQCCVRGWRLGDCGRVPFRPPATTHQRMQIVIVAVQLHIGGMARVWPWGMGSQCQMHPGLLHGPPQGQALSSADPFRVSPGLLRVPVRSLAAQCPFPLGAPRRAEPRKAKRCICVAALGRARIWGQTDDSCKQTTDVG